VALPLPLDPTPSSIESLLERLPARGRAHLAWFPEAVREAVVRPLRQAAPGDFMAAVEDVAAPAVRLFTRLGRDTAELFEDPAIAELLAPAGGQPPLSSPLDPRIEERLRPVDSAAADDLREAHAWLRAILYAMVLDFRSELAFAASGSAADLSERGDAQIRDQLVGAEGFLLRGTLLTIAASEVVLGDEPFPPSIGLWCRLAAREIQAAANALRARGLAVPTAVTTARAHSVCETAPRAWPTLARKGTLPPGVLDRLVAELRPEEIWLFGSRARGTHGPQSDWDLLVVLPDGGDVDPDEVAERPGLQRVQREGVELFAVRRGDFEEARDVLGTLSHLAVTQGRRIHAR